MAAPASRTELVREAIRSLHPDRPAVADCFEDVHLLNLFDAGFQSVDLLRTASKESLQTLDLRLAHIDNLKHGESEFHTPVMSGWTM